MDGSKTSKSEWENRNLIVDKYELSGLKATFPSVNVKCQCQIFLYHKLQSHDSSKPYVHMHLMNHPDNF